MGLIQSTKTPYTHPKPRAALRLTGKHWDRALRKDAGPYCGPRLFLRKGEVFAYVGLPQNLKDLKGLDRSARDLSFLVVLLMGSGSLLGRKTLVYFPDVFLNSPQLSHRAFSLSNKFNVSKSVWAQLLAPAVLTPPPPAKGYTRPARGGWVWGAKMWMHFFSRQCGTSS